jgi:hypothetical protein
MHINNPNTVTCNVVAGTHPVSKMGSEKNIPLKIIEDYRYSRFAAGRRQGTP